MRHFSTSSVVSLVLRGEPSVSMQEAICLALADAVEPRGVTPVTCISQDHEYYQYGTDEFLTPQVMKRFIFFGDRVAAHALFDNMTPAEFRSVVNFRIWYKRIANDFKYRSPKFWTRCGDFMYVNLNTGKSFVCVDAHYWD